MITLPGVFAPRSDSWLLARVLEDHVTAGATVLDMCTGSGVLALTAARRGARRVVAVDVSRRAALSARVNGLLNGVRVHSRVGDLFEVVAHERFDVIVSNPPYVPMASKRPRRFAAERAWHGGRDGRALLDRVCAGARAHLKPGGTFLLVHSSVDRPHETLARLSAEGMSGEIVARRRGPLGPLLARRAGALRAAGRPEGARLEEELVVVRARCARERAGAHA